MNIGTVGPFPGSSQLVGGADLPSSPTARSVFMKTSGGSEGMYICFSSGSWVLLEAASGAGTVTSVSVVSANGVSGVVANPTTTPAITLALGAITPTTVNGLTISSTTGTLSLTNAKTLSVVKTMSLTAADDTGVYTLPTGTKTLLATDGSGTGLSGVTLSAIVPNTAPTAGQLHVGNAGGTAFGVVSMSGDATLGSTGALTLASTISAGGPIGSATVAPIITYDAKGRLTTVTSATITPAVGSITGLGTGVGTALAVNAGSAGAFVVLNGALGTPSSGTLTSCTGLPISTGLTGAGTGVLTALGVNVGSAGSFVTFNGNAGTPSALVGTNISGTAASLTAGTASAVAVGGITGLGTGVGTWLATPSSANLRSALTDENGTGAALFDAATTPTFTTGIQIGGAAASRKILVGNGTNFIPSTETWAAPSTSGNVLTSDGTNWTSAVPAAAAAGSLTGTTLASNVVATSITSVGILTAHTVSGQLLLTNNGTQGFQIQPTTGTNGAFGTYVNTGGTAYIGTDNSAGTSLGGTAYSLVIRPASGKTVTFVKGDASTIFLTIDNAGGVTSSSLAGTGSRAVVADANGLLSAPVSDETFKEPLRALPESYGLDMVMKLRPSIFKYRDKKRFGSQDYLGFGARETSKVLPEVTGQMNDGTYYLTDEKLVVVLMKAVQQLSAKVESLQARI